MKYETPENRVICCPITSLQREPNFLCEQLTDILYGTTVEVHEDYTNPNTGNGYPRYWSFVTTIEGYQGWAYPMYMTPWTDAPHATHIIHSPIAKVYEGPDSVYPSTVLVGGTRVEITEYSGVFGRFEPVGKLLKPGWISMVDLLSRTAHTESHTMRGKRVVASAREMTGTYFRWGGNSTYGSDCSGLPYIVHRMNDIVIPRDCAPQFKSGVEVKEPFKPGDCLFFMNEKGTGPGHVAISTGGWNIIHCSRTRNGVYEEDVQQNENLRSTFIGARNFVSSEPPF